MNRTLLSLLLLTLLHPFAFVAGQDATIKAGAQTPPNQQRFKAQNQYGLRYVTGRVLADADSRPLAGISVQLSAGDNSKTLITDANGSFSGYINGLPIVARVEDPRFVSIVRHQPLLVGAWQVPDLRLTPRAAPVSLPATILGVGFELQPSANSIAITPFSAQALPALLPPGYSPVFGFEVQGLISAAQLKIQAPGLRSPGTGAKWELLRREGLGWRLEAQAPVISPYFTFSAATDASYLLAYRDPAQASAAIGALLERVEDALVPAVSLGHALANPSLVSILDTPLTQFHLNLDAAGSASGARAVVALRERHESVDGSLSLPEERLDLYCYAYGSGTPGTLAAQIGVMTRKAIDPDRTLSAHIAFEATSLRFPDFQVPDNGDLGRGPLNFDFDEAMEEPLAVAVRDVPSEDLPLLPGASLRASFELEVGGTLLGQVGLTYRGPESAALVLLRRLEYSAWAYAGAMRLEAGAWRLDREHADFDQDGVYALVALPRPVREFVGQIRAGADPIEGARVSLNVHPWLGLSHANGEYRHFAEPVATSLKARAFDPLGYRSASREIALVAGDSPLLGQNFAITGSDFQLVSYEPSADTSFVPLLPEISLVFNLPVTSNSMIFGNEVQLVALDQPQTPLEIQVTREHNILHLIPQASLKALSAYEVRVLPGLLDLNGIPCNPASFRFHTRADQASSDLDLRRFYLSLENEALYLNGPKDAYPDRTYLTVLNMASAFSQAYSLSSDQDFKTLVRGVPGDLFELTANKPDGTIQTHKLDLVKLGPDLYRLGMGGFTIDFGTKGALMIDKVTSGSGTPVTIRAIEPQVIQDQAFSTAALRDPDHPDQPVPMNVHLSFEILAAPGVVPPSFVGQLAFKVPEPTTSTHFGAFGLFEQDMPEAPDSQVLRKTPLVQVFGDLVYHPKETAKDRNKFLLGLMMDIFFNPTGPAGIYCGVIDYPGRQPNNNFLYVRTHRSETEHIPHPKTRPPTWYKPETQIHVPHVPIWLTNLGHGTSIDPRTTAGVIPVGYTNASGDLKSFFNGPLRLITGTDPFTGQIKLGHLRSNIAIITPWNELISYSFFEDVHFEWDDAEFQLPPEASWSWVLLKPVGENDWEILHEESEKVNQFREIHVSDTLRLGIKVAFSDEVLTNVTLSGVTQNATSFQVTDHSRIMILPESVLKHPIPLDYQVRAFTSGGTFTQMRATLSVLDDRPPVDVPGKPFLVYAPEGGPFPLSQFFFISISENVRGWHQGVTLVDEETGQNIPIYLTGDDGKKITSDSMYSRFARVYSAQALRFSHTYSIHIKGLTDLVGNSMTYSPPAAEGATEIQTRIFTQSAPTQPEPFFPNSSTRWSVAHYLNITVFLDYSDMISRKVYFHVYNMANPNKPKLIRVLESTMPPQIRANFAIVTPFELGPDNIGLYPIPITGQISDLPLNSYFVIGGYNAAIGTDIGVFISNHMLLYKYINTSVSEENPDSINTNLDESAYKADYLGRFVIQETGLMEQFVKIGAYLAIAFDDWFEPKASTLVLDMRIMLQQVEIAIFARNTRVINNLEFEGALALAASQSSTRFPHPTDPQGVDFLFRYSEDHVYRPTLLIAGSEFPGIYDFVPGSMPLATGPPIETLEYTDQRYLGQTSWNGFEKPHAGKSVGSVSQMEYWDSSDSAFKRGDFAVFSVSKLDTSRIFIYEIPKEPHGRSDQELVPIIQMNFDFNIKLMSVDSTTGLVALMDRSGLLSVFDLRRVLETRQTQQMEVYAVSNYRDPIFILPEPMQVYFSTFMEFENGIVYGASPGNFETYFIPIDPRQSNLGQIQFEAVPDELGQKFLNVPFADYLENEQIELDACEADLGDEEDPDQPEPRPVPLKLTFAAPANEVVEGTFTIEAVLNGDLIRVYEKANQEDPGQILELPQTYLFERLPRQIWLWGLQAGEAMISISYFSREGQLVSKDYVKLKISRWLEGPGVVSGDGYIGDYELTIEDALESEGPCGEEIEREFGFKLNRNAEVSLKLGGKTIYAKEHLKAGVYNKPIKLKVGKTPWQIQVLYPNGDGETTDEGTIEITQGWEDKLTVGSTAFKGVNLTSGVLTTGTVDIDIPNGFGLGLTFNRNYASTADQDYSPLGIGWSHNYQTRLIRGECGGLVVIGGEDSGKSYDENTGLPNTPGIFSRLIRNNRRGYTLSTKSRTRWVYGEPLPPGSVGSTDPLLFQSNLLEIIDPFGNKTSFSYNPDNKQLEKITDPSGRSLVFTYSKDGLYPLLQKITTENVEPAITVYYEYDSGFRLTKVSRGARSDNYQYADPCLPKGEANLLIAYSDSMGATTRYEYDDENRIVAIHEPEQISYALSYQVSPTERKTLISDAFAVTSYEFDLFGHLIKVEGPLGTKTMAWDNESGNLLREVDELGNETLFEYDERGNMTKRTSPMGIVETWVYNQKWNRPIQFTDALGGVKTWEIDATTGQVTDETDAEGFRTSFNYNLKGLMTSTTDARGNQTQFEYDAYGYQTAIIQADGNVVASSFDSRGRLLSHKDASDGMLVKTYNDLDQVVDERIDAVQSGGKHNENLEILPTGHVTLHRMGKVLTRREFDQQYREVHREVTPGQGLPSIITDYVYDAKSNLVRESIRGEGGTRVYEREYDAAGRMTLVKLNGALYNKLTYAPGSNQPSSIEDYSGAITSFEYDVLGRQIKQIFHNGQFTETEYDKHGNTLRETGLDGFATLYSYDKLDRVISVTNPLGEVTHYGYDGNGNQVSKYEEALDYRVTNSYDNMNRPQTSRIQSGDLDQTSSYQYQFGGGKNYTSFQPPLGAAIETHYNALGQVISRRQNGIEVGYTYDANGNIATVDYPGGHRISQLHDGIGQLRHESSPNGEETRYSYDFLGQLVQVVEVDGTQTDLSYDDFNNLTSSIKRRGSEIFSESWTYSYDNGYTTETHTDHRGNQTTQIKDALSRPIRALDVARAAESTFAWEGSQLKSITDPLGQQRQFQYDPLGRLLQVVEEDGLSSTRFSYSDGGKTQTMTDPNGVAWRFDYDGAGKLRRQYQSDQLINQYHYDQNNRLIRTQDAEGITTLFDYDAMGSLVSLQTGSDRIEWSDIDAFGNPRLVTHGELSKRFEYDFHGNLLLESNGAGETTRYQYNTKHLLVSKLSQDSEGDEVVTSYEYDLNGNLKKITEPGGLVTSFQWNPNWTQLSVTDPGGTVSTRELDLAGRLVNYSYPGAGSTHFEYNALDQPIRVQFGTGSVSNSYDPLGRLVREDWSGNADPNAAIHSIQRTYDKNGNLLSVTQNGSEGAYTRTIGYDTFNRPIRLSDSRQLTYELGYYLNGSRKYIRDALGKETGYQYDTANRLNRVTLPGGAFVDYQYLSSGLLERINQGNGVSAQYAYDAAGRPTSLVYTRTDGVSRFNTSYYPNGFRASYSEDRGALGIWNTQYHYDRAGRLTGWKRATPSGERTTSLTLDGAGNRLGEQESGAGYQRSRTYQLEFNRVASFHESLTRDNLAPETRDVAFSYDSSGNRISKTETLLEAGTSNQTQMVWDARKRMRKILRDGTALLAFEYDDLDRRIVKQGDQRDSAPIHYLWDELAPLHEFTASAGALQARSSYYYGQSLLAMDQVGAARQWVGEDVLGSIVERTSDEGALLFAQSYDPFGQAENLYQSPLSDWMRLGFTGHESDPESGLIYAKARFYDADLGLFASTDPELGNDFTPPSLHRYLYGNGNPLAFVDPTGRSSEESGETEQKEEKSKARQAYDYVVDKGSDAMLAVKDQWDKAKERHENNTDPDKPGVLAEMVFGNPISMRYLQREGETWEERAAPGMSSNPLFSPFASVLSAFEQVDQLKDGLNDINRALENGDSKAATMAGKAFLENVVVSGAAQVAPAMASVAGKAVKAVSRRLGDLPQRTTRAAKKIKDEVKIVKEAKRGSGTTQEFLDKRKAIKAARKESIREVKYEKLVNGGFKGEEANSLIQRGVVCFVAGTMVVTAEGAKPIEQVQLGDLVLSRDENGGASGLNPVIALFTTQPETLYQLGYQDESGEKHQLTTTAEHPFYVVEQETWVRAADLKLGDRFETATHKTAELVRMEIQRGPPGSSFTTYNLTVETYHTYYVAPVGTAAADAAELALWVHNFGNKPCGKPASVETEKNLEGGLQPHPKDRMDLPGGHRGRYHAAAHHAGIERLPSDWDVHHSIPQILRHDPRIAGIDIDSPLHTRGVQGSRSKNNIHQKISNDWAAFLKKNPNATLEQILNFRDEIDNRYGKFFWENRGK